MPLEVNPAALFKAGLIVLIGLGAFAITIRSFNDVGVAARGGDIGYCVIRGGIGFTTITNGQERLLLRTNGQDPPGCEVWLTDGESVIDASAWRPEEQPAMAAFDLIADGDDWDLPAAYLWREETVAILRDTFAGRLVKPVAGMAAVIVLFTFGALAWRVAK